MHEWVHLCGAQILDVLQKNGCKATFFLIGGNMDKFPHLVKRMHDEGDLCPPHAPRLHSTAMASLCLVRA